jgi:acetyl-CoA carboxylase biotin carboxylase subunit
MRRVLVANRGEIAARVVRACFDEGLLSVVAASAADRDSVPTRAADDHVLIGPAPAGESYLSVERIVAAAKAKDCDALHPGYGFLSERPELAEACEEHGITFVGPPAHVLRRAGDKMEAREAARALGIPTGGGSTAIESLDHARNVASEIGYPLMLKASAGGGGRGMAIINGPEDLDSRLAASRAEAQQAFGDGRVYLERYVARARHVEVQILADAHGNVVHLGDRDCSCQRRYQKLFEEAPAPGLPEVLVDSMRKAAVSLATGLDYCGAGTVEFLVDSERGDFVFLEVNARVQVEHPVTEAVTGIDIVREQLRIAAGSALSFDQSEVRIDGHAVECRINAEDPSAGFAPRPGTITSWTPPAGEGIRLDTHCETGTVVSPYYDSLLGKLIVRGADRDAALTVLERALAHFHVAGVPTTIPLYLQLLENADFRAGAVTTKWLEDELLGDLRDA